MGSIKRKASAISISADVEESESKAVVKRQKTVEPTESDDAQKPIEEGKEKVEDGFVMVQSKQEKAKEKKRKALEQAKLVGG